MLSTVLGERHVSARPGHLEGGVLGHQLDRGLLVVILHWAGKRSIALVVLLGQEAAIVLRNTVLEWTCVLTLMLEGLVEVLTRTLGLLEVVVFLHSLVADAFVLVIVVVEAVGRWFVVLLAQLSD